VVLLTYVLSRFRAADIFALLDKICFILRLLVLSEHKNIRCDIFLEVTHKPHVEKS